MGGQQKKRAVKKVKTTPTKKASGKSPAEKSADQQAAEDVIKVHNLQGPCPKFKFRLWVVEMARPPIRSPRPSGRPLTRRLRTRRRPRQTKRTMKKWRKRNSRHSPAVVVVRYFIISKLMFVNEAS
jgi:hypothetical protein